ncbi:MAG TPA: amino acid adenylation domain-containing protein [Patescibacteria group bacterium]|nr:amino acid adenylation domain-containing protein [Patescibacteria group bacterium]
MMRYLLHDVFLESCRRAPERTAIITEAGDAWTYAALNAEANRFAEIIAHAKPGDRRQKPFVGILSSVHSQSIAAILGTLKLGCAYVPLDEYSPVERLAKIIENTKLDVVCVDSHLYKQHAALFDHPDIKAVVLLNNDVPVPASAKTVTYAQVKAAASAEPPLLNQVSDDLAYILHSSGSTGVPKGIMLTHRNARTFTDWMQKEFALTPEDVVASRAPFKFDLSVFDIFNTFLAGATLACFDWNRTRDGDAKHADYVKMMARCGATILYTTPSTLIALRNRGGLDEAALKLRTIMYAGEPFPPAQLRRVMQALPGVGVANIYGPTETNIITCYWVPAPPVGDNPIPLGKVVEDTEIIVMDNDSARLCAPGELGELWCRGGTVTLGYLGMEDKTRECLVQSPVHPYPALFWRTGDYGFYDEAGVLHYRGRKDHMVKVKGFRIELGEIEIALSQHGGLDEFAVVAVADLKYGNRLYCHYAPLAGRTVSPGELQQFLATKLPEYMIPFGFQPWPALPKTSSGKADRVMLAEVSAGAELRQAG